MKFDLIILSISFILFMPVQLPADPVQGEILEDPSHIRSAIQIHDSLLQVTLSDSDIIALNTEELVDPLIRIPGITIFDLGMMGQFSSLGYRGTGKNHILPVLNSIPLETESYGPWNWHDLPFYIVQKIEPGRRISTNLTTVYQSVLFSSKSHKSTTPFSKVNYRLGDYGWRHVDVMLARTLGKGKSMYAAGSSEKFPGALIDNRYRGSNVWIQFNHRYSNIDFTWQALVSDKNVRELSDLPVLNGSAIKDLPHSHNAKFLSLNISKSREPLARNATLYYTEVKDNAAESALLQQEFSNLEKKIGITIKGGSKAGNSWDYAYSVNSYSTSIKSTFWNDLERINVAKFSLSVGYDSGKKYSLLIKPELNLRSHSKGNPLTGTAVVRFDVSPGLALEFSASTKRRYVTIAEKNITAISSLPDINKPIENINSYSIDIRYNFNKGFVRFSPFFLTLSDPLFFVYDNGNFTSTSQSAKSLSSIGILATDSFKNGGIELEARVKVSDDSGVNLHYTYQGGKKSRLFAAPHLFYFQAFIKNLEDRITSLDIDTELIINVYFKSASQRLAYLPLYQQVILTDGEAESIAGIKARGSARVETLTLYYEIDLLSKRNYQYILGYPQRNRMIRVGLTWDFYN